MSANPPKNDAWCPYGDVRFVLIRNVGRLKPSRGLILDWKREGRRWEALVVWRDDAALKPVVKMDWLRIEDSSRSRLIRIGLARAAKVATTLGLPARRP